MAIADAVSFFVLLLLLLVAADCLVHLDNSPDNVKRPAEARPTDETEASATMAAVALPAGLAVGGSQHIDLSLRDHGGMIVPYSDDKTDEFSVRPTLDCGVNKLEEEAAEAGGGGQPEEAALQIKELTSVVGRSEAAEEESKGEKGYGEDNKKESDSDSDSDSDFDSDSDSEDESDDEDEDDENNVMEIEKKEKNEKKKKKKQGGGWLKWFWDFWSRF